MGERIAQTKPNYRYLLSLLNCYEWNVILVQCISENIIHLCYGAIIIRRISGLCDYYGLDLTNRRAWVAAAVMFPPKVSLCISLASLLVRSSNVTCPIDPIHINGWCWLERLSCTSLLNRRYGIWNSMRLFIYFWSSYSPWHPVEKRREKEVRQSRGLSKRPVTIPQKLHKQKQHKFGYILNFFFFSLSILHVPLQ